MTDDNERLRLADEYQAGLDRMRASGYEEFDEAVRNHATVIAALRASSPVKADADWRDDPAQDERWNAGCDFAMTQLCNALGVDPGSVNWDAATETVDGDVQSVIWNILRARMGEDWNPGAATPDTSASVGLRALQTCREFIRGEQIENAVVCIGSMQSLGDMIDEALAAANQSDDTCVCSGHQQPNCAHWRMGKCKDKPGPANQSDVEALAATTAERPGTITSEPEPSTSELQDEYLAGIMAKVDEPSDTPPAPQAVEAVSVDEVAWQPMDTAPKGEVTEDAGCRGASEWFFARPSKKYEPASPVVVVRRRCWPQDDHWEDNGETYYRPDYFKDWTPLSALLAKFTMEGR